MTSHGYTLHIGRTARRLAAAAVACVLAIGGSAACTDPPSAPAEPVTITWWTQEWWIGPDDLRTFWEGVAADFTALHPTVTIEFIDVMVEWPGDPLAMIDSPDPPDLFGRRGRADLVEPVGRGLVRDITDEVGDLAGPAAEPWRVGGRTYGLPYSVGIEGFFYSKALFTRAGIAAPPTTIDELNDAVGSLKAAGIIPIAVGAADTWPAAHYWYNFALRACPAGTLRQSVEELLFDDPCFVRAGEDLAAFLATDPFPDGFLDTPQRGATALLAGGGAAMELAGYWEPDGLDELEPVGDPFGWFAFPSTGGAGDPGAHLGGGNGFACSATAPPECVELLRYIVSPTVQQALGETGQGLPVAGGTAVAHPALAPMLAARDEASHVQLWLDTAYGEDIGSALNDAILTQFAGTGTAQDVVDALHAAVA